MLLGTKPFTPEHDGSVNIQNPPTRALPKGFEGATEMGKGGGTLTQLKSELHIACFTTNVAKVRCILGAGNATSNYHRVNSIDMGSPPLIYAVRVKANTEADEAKIAEIAKMLIEAGADVNYKQLPSEESPLILASIFSGGVGKVQTVRTLTKAGANLRQRDKQHRMTALHWAITSGWFNVVEALIEAGASCTSRGGKDKLDALEMSRHRLHQLKKGSAIPTGPRDVETRKAELEKMVVACEVGAVARNQEKAEKKAARKTEKRASSFTYWPPMGTVTTARPFSVAAAAHPPANAIATCPSSASEPNLQDGPLFPAAAASAMGSSPGRAEFFFILEFLVEGGDTNVKRSRGSTMISAGYAAR
ncbi:hypothetical protein Ctob_009593 [Chrysochromulina tobinii]|uniref:Uncharacterized protein n=1 Tax=Chrysochromulina tobinii TaxID=1460289 RepID=A0A0M0JII4_9EUKA|nr:hypothetical protein Ctob_009593 [Chrysochromulina tobinii]|eukprot:KOO26300.1 hypothetical protein Ctob_009593 [Chrysochromulina sp. CCMP291]